MILILLVSLILGSAAQAQPVSTSAPPSMSIEQRLAVQIANLSLQNAQLASKLDELTAELDRAKKQCKPEAPK